MTAFLLIALAVGAGYGAGVGRAFKQGVTPSGGGPSGDAYLNEDGSYLLNEDGSFLLLE